MNDEMRAKVSALLEAVVTADGVIRPEERDFVRRAANRWKLPDPDAPLSLRTLGSATAALRALDPDAQARVLALLVDAAAVDHHLDSREHARRTYLARPGTVDWPAHKSIRLSLDWRSPAAP